MSCAFSWPLQQALFGALSANAEIAALVGAHLYDDPPEDEVLARDGAAWIVLGDEQVTPWSTASDQGAAHMIEISVITAQRGFATAKRIAGAICEATLGTLSLSRGRVVNASFLGAKTRRSIKNGARRIDLRFRIAIEDQQ
jgi:hypothetical protein